MKTIMLGNKGCQSREMNCGRETYEVDCEQKSNQVMSGDVIFVSSCEHHSNLFPWRELGEVDVEMVRLDPITGSLDLHHLYSLLAHYEHRTVKIVAFSAASNVTGVLADDIRVTAILHEHGALSVWDYATGASYLDMQMNPCHPQYEPHLTAKDAIVCSGHKLLGGVGTPGILIIKKHLVSRQNAPTRCGGGTVFYVTEEDHRFLSDPIERYEGGTPNIVGIWRLGLVFTNKLRLKAQRQTIAAAAKIGPALESDLQRALWIQRELVAIPNLVVVDAGYSESPESSVFTYKKLPIYSFLIKCGTRFLHYNFISALFNDVFGVQTRGGCSCAGPFAQYLLGLDKESNDSLTELLLQKYELLRPGFVRLSLPFFGTTKEMEDYVIRAIAWVAQNGWKLLHLYQCNVQTGVWRHISSETCESKRLSQYSSGPTTSLGSPRATKSTKVPSLKDTMKAANALLEAVAKDESTLSHVIETSNEEKDNDPPAVTSTRWFVYPKEVALFVKQGSDEVPETMDRQALVGVVRPVAWFPRKQTLTSTSLTAVTNKVEYDWKKHEVSIRSLESEDDYLGTNVEGGEDIRSSTTTVEKLEMMKPKRDSAVWGQGDLVPYFYRNRVVGLKPLVHLRDSVVGFPMSSRRMMGKHYVAKN